MIMGMSSRVALLASVCVLLGSLLSAQTPAPLASAEAGKFMGAWLLTLESPQGAFSMTLTLSDKDGHVAGELTSDIAPPQNVADISKTGNDLVLKYQGDFQGQAFAAKITLTPVDDKLGINFDVMDGQFMMSGIGTKK
jgi:hypothetical protein